MMPLDRGRSLWASHGPSIAGALGAMLFLCAGLVNGRAAAAGGIPDNVVLLSNLRYRDGSRACVLDLALPKARADRPRPAVVVIHGGGWIEGDKSSFDVQRTPGNIIDFAAAGFVAASVNYRLSREAPFPAGLYDCQAAVRWLRAHAGEYHLDPNRIGAYGNSAGGHLALLLGLLGPSSGLDERGGPFPAEASGVRGRRQRQRSHRSRRGAQEWHDPHGDRAFSWRTTRSKAAGRVSGGLAHQSPCGKDAAALIDLRRSR